MNFIITGGAGFIGINIALELEKQGHHVYLVDNLSSGSKDNLKEFQGTFIQEDIRTIDWEKRFGNLDIACVFHEAAITDTRVMDERLIKAVNVDAFKRLAEYCISKNIKLVYASSAAVYGSATPPMKEDQKLTPLNPYGKSKMKMDEVALELMEKSPKSIIIGLRYFNVFGPYEAKKGSFASMIYQLYTLMKKGKNPRVFSYGEQTRDHVYVKDVVKINLLAYKSKKSGIYNTGTGIETSFNEIIENWNKLLDLNLKTEFMENPYGFFQKRTCADLGKIRVEFGYKPEFNVEKGMEDYLMFLKKENL